MKIELIGPFEKGGFFTEVSELGQDSIVYSLGVGDNILWDLEMIKRFKCKIYAFDPDPLAIDWLSKQTLPQEFVFSPVGISGSDGSQIFYQPYRPGKIDKSAVLKTSIPSILPVKRLQTLMKERGHAKIDVLKVNIEGSEFAALSDILKIPIKQLIIEFHGRYFRRTGWLRTQWAFVRLWMKGFRHVATEGLLYTYIAK